MSNNRLKSNKKLNVWKNRLSVLTFLAKTGLLTVLNKAVKRLNANRYTKKYDRGKLAAILIIAIIIGSTSYKLEVEDYLYIAMLTGQNGIPAKSTISKTWGKLVDILYYTYRHYTRQLKERLNPICESAKEVLIIDIKAIETKSRYAKLGYIHGRLKKGIKLHMSTLNSSPWIYFISPADEHDSTYLDNFVKRVKENVDGYPVYIVADRAFSFLGKIAELAKIGVYLITPYKRNMKNFKLLKAAKTGDLFCLVYSRVVDGVNIFLVEAYDSSTGKTWLILTPVDDPELAVRLYRMRWSIEVLFRNLSTLNFRLLGYTYEAIVASVLLYLLAYVLLRLYSIMLNRRFSISKFVFAFYRWFFEVFKRVVIEHVGFPTGVKPPPRTAVKEVINWLKGQGAIHQGRQKKPKNGLITSRK